MLRAAEPLLDSVLQGHSFSTLNHWQASPTVQLLKRQRRPSASPGRPEPQGSDTEEAAEDGADGDGTDAEDDGSDSERSNTVVFLRQLYQVMSQSFSVA